MSQIILYKQETGTVDPAVAFSTVFDRHGHVFRTRMYRLYPGHAYNRGE
ncbi:MAG: hypothetical protein K8R64_05250 [Methanosarcinaceae archaeon]|nr:hypothetical protein [Methanosarcinaceae archaeon]